MKKLNLAMILMVLSGTGLLTAAAAPAAIDPADITLREKTTDFETVLGDVSAAARDARASEWERDFERRDELYAHEFEQENFRRRMGLSDRKPEMQKVIDLGRVIQKLRADYPFPTAMIAKDLERRATRGYLQWRKAHPGQPLYLYTEPTPLSFDRAAIVDLKALIALGADAHS